MKYTGLELFMEKLKQMIYNDDDNPLINNHPSILSQRPQFQLLYEELGSVIQILHSIDDEHQQVNDLKRRLKDAAEVAHDFIDLFVYNINRPKIIPKRIKERILRGVCSPIQRSLFKREVSQNLDDIMRSIKSIKEEFITIQSNMKMDSSPRKDDIKTTFAVVAETSCTKGTLGLGRKKVSEDIVVGFDHHVELIRNKLVEDQKQLDVVSIVGMGGLGKTTLATQVFNDPFIKYHFYIRGWVTVSQTYEKQNLLIQILESIGAKIDNTRDYNYSQLREKLHKTLMGNRYLIVIDDIWSIKVWDVLKLFFPNSNTQSRILITSRFKEVAFHANSRGFIHQLEYLTEEGSWELLCRKVFHDINACPEWLVEPGMRIAKNCHGLPLTLVVIGGVLAKEPLRKDSWDRIGQSVSSYIVNNESEFVETLAWSLDHLPGHLKGCFLYLGGFPEDHKFQVQRLIWLWIAEGFIEEDGIRSLEEIAEGHMIELVDRNLVVVADRKSLGGIKSFYVHDLLRELCFKIAMKENFYLKVERATRSVETYKQRRIFIEDTINIDIKKAPRIRSLFYFNIFADASEALSYWSPFLKLLMVLDLQCLHLHCFPGEISQLFYLRYLAIPYHEDGKFLSSICNLWNLQTLVMRGYLSHYLELTEAISNLVNLRHLRGEGYRAILFPTIKKPMKLQSISKVIFRNGSKSWVECFPCIKKLSCDIQMDVECDLRSLPFLEHLKLSRSLRTKEKIKFLGFPLSLKSLTLDGCFLCWSDMKIIQSLPKLEVLKLRYDTFMGPRWDAGEEQFRLKVLELFALRIKEWEASSFNFPCLEQLLVRYCDELEEIPLDLGNIPTLELISITKCNNSVVESVDTIQEEQHSQGNFELKISVVKK